MYADGFSVSLDSVGITLCETLSETGPSQNQGAHKILALADTFEAWHELFYIDKIIKLQYKLFLKASHFFFSYCILGNSWFCLNMVGKEINFRCRVIRMKITHDSLRKMLQAGAVATDRLRQWHCGRDARGNSITQWHFFLELT